MIPLTIGGVTLNVNPALTGQLNSKPDSAGIAEYCECNECLARLALARLLLCQELVSVLVPLRVTPINVTLRKSASRRKGDPAGFVRETWLYPICGEHSDFQDQAPQPLGDQDLIWLTRQLNADVHLQFWQMEAYDRQKEGICAWLNVSRLVPDLASTAPSYVHESFRDACPRCSFSGRISFYPKRKSSIYWWLLSDLGVENQPPKGFRVKASYCTCCFKDLSSLVPDHPPFFDSSVERRPRRKLLREM